MIVREGRLRGIKGVKGIKTDTVAKRERGLIGLKYRLIEGLRDKDSRGCNIERGRGLN